MPSTHYYMFLPLPFSSLAHSFSVDMFVIIASLLLVSLRVWFVLFVQIITFSVVTCFINKSSSKIISIFTMFNLHKIFYEWSNKL